MAKPIEETPILYDEDAYRFEMAMRDTEPFPTEKKDRMDEAYRKLSKVATFSL